MRIRTGFTTKWRVAGYAWIIGGVYGWYNPAFYTKLYDYLIGYGLDPTYSEWHGREEHRWKEYLRKWDPKYNGNILYHTLGYYSTTAADLLMMGEQRFRQPPPYERLADDFILHAEKTQLDPAKPLYDTIKKMVDYYYPEDLDPNPEETRRVIQPKIQWIHKSQFDTIIEEESKKPPPSSLARYLWYIPKYQKFLTNLKKSAQEEEENMLKSLNGEERAILYEHLDHVKERWGSELRDYLPLLAYRWDRKVKLVDYLTDSTKEEEITQLITEPNGIRQIFVNAGIITFDHKLEEEKE